MVAGLEEEMEWLSHPLARSQPQLRTPSRSRDHQIHGSRGWRRRHCQMWPESCLAPYFEYHPSRRNLESSRETMATEDPDLGEPLELGLEVTCFLRGLAKNSEGEEKAPSPNPQWRSSVGGWLGEQKLVRHQAGGESWWQYQRCKTAKSWHRRCGPHFISPKGQVS